MSGDALKAFILGSTGQVGKALARELTRTEAVSNVTLFTRRSIEPNQGDPDNDYSKVVVKVVDFDKLATDHVDDFQGFDLGYCALGVLGTGQKEAKMRVEHDYLLEAAKLAKVGGCKNFVVVTGAGGANPGSRIYSMKVKGLIEQDVTSLGFDRVAYYRPAGLVGGEHTNAPLSYKIMAPILKLDCGHVITCEVPVLAKVMIHNSLQPPKTPPVDVYENCDINKMGKELVPKN